MSRLRANIRTQTNTKKARKEKRNGRDVVIVPAATLPDDVVMNEILYPADEIAKGFMSLDRTPAPLGHPTINGQFVSAKDPEGINIGWIGAWNENVRRENGRVFLDKVIDVEVAQRSEGGKKVLNAIDTGEPIHTSTGVYFMPEAANGDVPYKQIARELFFDHDAILLDMDGAATPSQGVGIFVNSKGVREEITVINSDLDAFDQEIDWAGTRLVEALRRKQDAGVWEKLKADILKALGFSQSEKGSSTNSQENDMSDPNKIDSLSTEVKTLSESVAALPESIAKAVADAMTPAINAALKPLVDAQQAAANEQKTKDDAELSELQKKIVDGKLMGEAGAKELTLNAARELAKQLKPGHAAGLNGAFRGTEQKPGFKLPAAEAK